jgi:hypothetical protein
MESRHGSMPWRDLPMKNGFFVRFKGEGEKVLVFEGKAIILKENIITAFYGKKFLKFFQGRDDIEILSIQTEA